MKLKSEKNVKIYLKIIIALIVTVFIVVPGCKKKERNEVPLEQIEIDNSTDYKYIFKDIIEKERMEKGKMRKDNFKE